MAFQVGFQENLLQTGAKRRRIDRCPHTIIRSSTWDGFSEDDEPFYYSQETRDTPKLANANGDDRAVLDSFQEWDILEDGDFKNEQDILEQQSYLELIDQLSDKPIFSNGRDLMDLDETRDLSELRSVSPEANTFDEQVVLDKARRNPLYRRHVWQLLARYKTPAPQGSAPKTPSNVDCSNLAREIYSILRCEKYTAAAAGRAASEFITFRIVNRIDAHSDTKMKYDTLNMLGKIFGNVSSWPPDTDSILAIQTGPFLYELAISLLQVGQMLSGYEAAQFCHNDEFLADVVLPANRNVETIGQMPYIIMKEFVNLLQRSLAQPAEIGEVVHDVVNMEPRVCRSISRNISGSNELQYDRCISSHRLAGQFKGIYSEGSQRRKSLNVAESTGMTVPRHSLTAGPLTESARTNASRSVASKLPKNPVSHPESRSPYSPEVGGIWDVPNSPEPKDRTTKHRAAQSKNLSQPRRTLGNKISQPSPMLNNKSLSQAFGVVHSPLSAGSFEHNHKSDLKCRQQPQRVNSCKPYDIPEKFGSNSTLIPKSEGQVGTDDEVIIVGLKVEPTMPSVLGSRTSSHIGGGAQSIVMAGFDPSPTSPVAPFSLRASPAVLHTHLADTRSTALAILPGDVLIAPVETATLPTPKQEVIDLTLIPDPDMERLLVAKRLADATDRLQTDKDEIERLIHSTISNIDPKSSPKRLIKRLETLVAIGHHVIARRNEKTPEPSNPWTDEAMQKLLTDSMLNICHMVGGNPKPRDFEFKYPHLLKNITADMMDLNRKGQLGKIKCLPGMGRVLSWFGLLGRCLADPRCVD